MKIKDLLNLFSISSIKQVNYYIISVASNMAFNLLLIIFLTRFVDAEQYGTIVLFKTSLLIIISLGGIGLSQSAVHWVNSNKKSLNVFGTILSGASLFSVLSFPIFCFTFYFLSKEMNINFSFQIVIYTLFLIFFYCVNNEIINWERVNNNAKRHAMFSLCRSFLQLLIVMAFIFLDSKLENFILGLLTNEVLFFFIRSFFKFPNIKFDFNLLKEMIKFGWPHALIISSTFALNYTDRYMIALLQKSLSDVAFYDAASIIVLSGLSFLSRPFNLFFLPNFTKKYYKQGKSEAKLLLDKCLIYYTYSSLIFASLIIFYDKQILALFYPEKYSTGTEIFPFISISIIINTLFMSYVTGLNFHNKAIIAGLSVSLAVLFNIVLNFFLIPKFGIVGAAQSTALASLFQLVIVYLFSKKLIFFPLPLNALLTSLCWLIIVYMLN